VQAPLFFNLAEEAVYAIMRLSMECNDKHILAVITARGASKGLPGKNIKELGGKPLIAYSIEAANASRLISHVVVSTDDPQIAEVSRQWGGEVPFMRPVELATDSARHLGVMQHAVTFMEDSLGVVFDAAIILQPTSPFRLPEDIDDTISKLFDTNSDSAVSICEVETSSHPIKMKRLEGGFLVPYVVEEPEGTIRQFHPPCYKRSSAVYVTRRDTLINEGRVYGSKIAAHIVPADRSIDIDTPRDWAIAEWMLESLREKGLFVG
jgi:CMP-N,N'-diacetyllegionaminic acid synthase